MTDESTKDLEAKALADWGVRHEIRDMTALPEEARAGYMAAISFTDSRASVPGYLTVEQTYELYLRVLRALPDE